MKKRILCAVLLAAFLFPFGTLAAAPEPWNPDGSIMPLAQDMASGKAELSVSGKKGTYTLKVTGASGVTKITATLQIQKKNPLGQFMNYGSSWTATASKRTLTASGTKTVDSGNVYRLKCTVKLYTGSSYSTEVVYS